MQVVLDWFQVNTRGHLRECPSYTLRSTDRRSQVFANITEILHNGEIIAISAHNPISSILPPLTHIIKFINSILYDPEFPTIFNDVMTKMGLHYVGVTRVDIAFDFNEFANHRQPPNLIKQFMSEQLTYWGKSQFQIRGRNSFNIKPDYLRFGGNDSLASIYLYNKSYEMSTIKWKPYIHKNWKLNGLDVNKAVWRLELSIKGSQHQLVDKSTGEASKLTPALLINPQSRHDLYFSFVAKLFQFCSITRKNHRSTKSFITLFDIPYNPWLYFIQTETKDSTRADRIMIKKLEQLNWELRNQNNSISIAASDLSEYIAESKGLEAYRRKLIII